MLALYLLLTESTSRGVIAKEFQRFQSLKAAGIDIDCCAIRFDASPLDLDKELGGSITFCDLPRPQLPTIFYRRYIRRFRWYFEQRALDRARFRKADEIAAKRPYDFILMRYQVANRDFLQFCRHHPRKIVFELNCNIMQEIPVGAYGGHAEHLLEQERSLGPRVLREAAGLVAVTPEILTHELTRSGLPSKRGTVISNGVDGTHLPVRTPRHSPNEIWILMVVGNLRVWHGLDRLLNGLQAYRGVKPITLVLVGALSTEELSPWLTSLPPTIRLIQRGVLTSAEMNQSFDECHIAVSSLGVHRSNHHQACPLKTREYLMRGIPFIYAYEDVDLAEAAPVKPYVLRLPADESAIEMERVVAFAEASTSAPSHSTDLRAFAERNVSMVVKMGQLADFLQRLPPP